MTGAGPDLILHGGRVYTVDRDDRVAEAVAIREGRIVAVGGTAEVRRLAGSNTREISLGGRAVVPGFVDGHPHMDLVGLGLIRPAFDAVRSIDEILAILKAEVARRRPGEWIVCNPIGTEPDLFKMPRLLKEERWPTRQDLDRVAPDNPVYIEPAMLAAPGHAFANSAAIRLAGITRDTKTPDGVEIELDERGEPTGHVKDFNFPKVIPDAYNSFKPERALFPMLPRLTHAEMVAAVRAGMKAFNAAGITTIYEGHGIPAEQQRAYLELWSGRELSVRTYFVISYPVPLYFDLKAGEALIRETSRYAAGAGFGDDMLRFGGLGFSFDSASAIGASLMREPYLGARGTMWNGIQLTSDETFKTILWTAARANLRVQVQCAGGAAIDKVLDMYEEIDREIPILGKRWVIEHCQFPSPRNMETCRRLGVIPTSTTNFLWLYGSVYVRSFGRELAQDAIPFKPWLEAGIPVVQSTDGKPYPPMFAFWQMLARKDGLTGEALTTPKQQLTRAEALRMYTANGAYATFWENQLGSLEPGKLADLAVLSQDIMTVDEDRIPETRVLATLVGGAAVHDAGALDGALPTFRQEAS
jgi:predicted amidohydrolase YtcJ